MLSLHQNLPALSCETKASLGIVGVIVHIPDNTVELGAIGALPDAGRKSTRWAGKTLTGMMSVGIRGEGGYFGAMAALLWTTVVISASIVAGAAGGVVGAVKADSHENIERNSKMLRAATMDAWGESRTQLVGRLRSLSNSPIVLIDQIAFSGGQEIRDSFLKESGIDSILEISLKGIRLVPDVWDSNPPLRLKMNTTFTLVSADDRRVLYDEEYQSAGPAASLADWAEDEGSLFKEYLKTACESTVEYIVNQCLQTQPVTEGNDHRGEMNSGDEGGHSEIER
jgi:hypothetical protein